MTDFLNVNGIFEGRFDIILTNPPFGANVEPSDVVHESDVTVSREAEKRYADEYGDLYTEALARVRAAVNKPIASLFELPKASEKTATAIKTEILFIERCLSLLKPGGRLGIVLPEGIFNNPSLAYVREFCENRAFIRAVSQLAPGDVLFLRRKREGIVAVPAKVHREGTGRFRRQAAARPTRR